MISKWMNELDYINPPHMEYGSGFIKRSNGWNFFLIQKETTTFLVNGKPVTTCLDVISTLADTYSYRP